MNKCYIIVITDYYNNILAISQEGYTTLAKTQNFCLNRCGHIRKCTEMYFLDTETNTGYEIREINIRNRNLIF